MTIAVVVAVLAVGALIRATRTESSRVALEIRAAGLVAERDELILELAEVRKQLIATVDQRNCVRDIADSLLEERDSIMAELKMLRGEPETDREWVN